MDQNSQQDELFAKQMKIKRHIKKIAITQTVLSVLCIILGIVGTALIHQHYKSQSSYSYYIPSTGSGIWSSVFTFIAGGIGIGVGSPRSGKGMIIAHMVFAILGCVSEINGITFSAIVATNACYSDKGSVMAIYIILCILSFISFSLLVTTSAFCCKLLKCCCGSATGSGHQVAYAPQTMVQTPNGMVMMQQPAGVVMMQQPQGTVMIQQPQGTVMMQQPQGTVMMQQPQGTVMMQQPQGTVMMQQPQGTVMMQQPQGTVMMQQPQGTIMMQQPQGAVMMQQPQGTVMMQQPQGTFMIQQPLGSVPEYSQPQTNSQDTDNLINSEETVQPQEIKIAPPSYS